MNVHNGSVVEVLAPNVAPPNATTFSETSTHANAEKSLHGVLHQKIIITVHMNIQTGPVTKGHNSYPWEFQQTVARPALQQLHKYCLRGIPASF